jgi:Na+/H+ antiporter NhaC
MKIPVCLVIILLMMATAPAEVRSMHIETPPAILSGLPVTLKIEFISDDAKNQAIILPVVGLPGIDSISIKTSEPLLIKSMFPEAGRYLIQIPGLNEEKSLLVLPGWVSILPPLLAILLAFAARQVLLALFFGVLVGTTLMHGYNPLTGFLYGLTDYIAKAPTDPDKMSILIFSLVLGGMVGVLTRMGGLQTMVNKLTPYASNPRYGQLITWSLGILIFFDDYANTLVVGNTMRPLTDKLKISREKLSYLVDATAAPVANIAVISTWVGYELSLIAAGLKELHLSQNAYITFLQTIPYNFYPLLALWFGFLIALMGRDFGSMLKAEQRARTSGALLSHKAQPLTAFDEFESTVDTLHNLKWYHGLIPILTVVFITFSGLWYTGYLALLDGQQDITSLGFLEMVSTIIGQSDPFSALLWASFAGSITAIIIACTKKVLTIDNAIAAWISGIKVMIPAALILTLAWSIGQICSDIKTADYIIEASKSLIEIRFLPLLTFITAAIISFATGTSWGVMAILMPIVIPLAHHHLQNVSGLSSEGIFLSTIAAVLAGATFGDHCSPISDTTVMSSMAASADHMDHVRTQLPYALLVGTISMFIGYLPAGFGLPWWVSLGAGIAAIALSVRFIGQKTEP